MSCDCGYAPHLHGSWVDACRYVGFDTLTMVVFSKVMKKAYKALYPQYMFHHIGSLVCFPFALARDKCVLHVAYLMCTEITSICIGARTVVRELVGNHPNASGIADLLGLVSFMAYFVVRIMPVPELVGTQDA
eukprot:scaffold7880_cov430-Prasinococcus_capsulatus_cf.AAC.1